MLLNDSLELIGNTPLIKLKGYNNIYAKIEKNNLSGSIKDRPAFWMLKKLFEDGKLHKGDTIIEPTSGNMGISLAALSNIFEINCIIIMPKSMSFERRKLIKDYSATLVLVDGGMKECVIKAKQLNEQIENSIIVDQFNNVNNMLSHYQTTIKEILNDLEDVDVIIDGIGTSGTISGMGIYIKDNNLNIEVIGIEPYSSPLISKKRSGAHHIQGIGANFVPPLFDHSLVSKIMLIKDEEAIECARKIVRSNGLLVGISSGANLAGALKLQEQSDYQNKKIVVIFPDSGERYTWE